MTHHGIPLFRNPSVFRMGIPPALGDFAAKKRAQLLSEFITLAMGQPSEVEVSSSYDSLTKDVLSGRLDAAWAPPVVCARLEAMGARVMLRSIRHGTSSYRAALVTRQDHAFDWNQIETARAVWSDQDSLGGYLLPTAYLRERGLNTSSCFAEQHFVKSYVEAVEDVLNGRADVTSVFAPAPGQAEMNATGLEDILPGGSARLKVIAFTEEAPNDGVAVSMGLKPLKAELLERALIDLHRTPDGQRILREVFSADGFEVAPKLSYRALYRLPMVSL